MQRYILFWSQNPPQSHTVDRPLSGLWENRRRQAFHPTLLNLIPVERLQICRSPQSSSVGGKGTGNCCRWANTGGTVDMDVEQDNLVIVCNFLPIIHLICSSISGACRHLVGIRTEGGTMIWVGSPDIHGFRRWILMQRRLWVPL